MATSNSASTRRNRKNARRAVLLLLALAIAATIAAACGGGHHGSGVITVNGHVTIAEGHGVAGVYVMVVGHPATFSSASGAFKVTGVTVPYVIAVYDSAAQVATVIEGVTTATPTLVVEPQVTRVVSVPVAMAGTSDSANVLLSSPTSTNFYHPFSGILQNVSFRWSGPASTTGLIYGVRFDRDPITNHVSSFPGFGSAPVTLHDNTAGTLVTVPLTELPPSLWSATIAPPVGYVPSRKTAHLTVQNVPLVNLGIFTDTKDAASFSTMIGNGLAVDFDGVAVDPVSSKASGVQAYGSAPNATPQIYALITAPDAVAPPDGVTAGVATPFVWTAFHDPSLYRVAIFATGTAAHPGMIVATLGTSMSIPDLSPIGFAFTPGATYTWTATGTTPGSLDDVTAIPQLVPSIHYTGSTAPRSISF
jgi:hypothetical protein